MTIGKPVKFLSAEDVVAIRKKADETGKQAGHNMDAGYNIVREKGQHLLVEVPINLLSLEYDGFEDEMTDSQKERIARYAKMDGTPPPIYITFSGNRRSKGRAFISDGNHRTQVAKEAGRKTMMAMMSIEDWNRWAPIHGFDVVTDREVVASVLRAAADVLIRGSTR